MLCLLAKNISEDYERQIIVLCYVPFAAFFYALFDCIIALQLFNIHPMISHKFKCLDETSLKRKCIYEISFFFKYVFYSFLQRYVMFIDCTMLSNTQYKVCSFVEWV